jgi:hypothetical protein
MYLCDLGAKLNTLKMGFDIPFMIHLALVSLPDEYENLISSYNNMKEKWTIDELISHIVLDEGRLKKSNKDHINNVDNKRKFHDKEDNNNIKKNNIILKPHASPIRTHLRTRPQLPRPLRAPRHGRRHYHRCNGGHSHSGSGRRWLSKIELRKIPVVEYETSKAGALPGTECAICLGEFVDGEKVRLLPRCRHCFHVQCIDSWLAEHSSCPICCSSLLKDDHGATVTGDEDEAT